MVNSHSIQRNIQVDRALGWMYTIFAIALLIGSVAILLTMLKGQEWRLKAEASEKN